MFINNDKEALKTEIKSYIAWPYIDLNNGNSPKQEIEQAIRMCVESAIDALIDKMYTNEEFEKDLGIR